jgi:hypothetical protein
MAFKNTGWSFGLLEVAILPETTTSSSKYSAPALIKSSFIYATILH